GGPLQQRSAMEQDGQQVMTDDSLRNSSRGLRERSSFKTDRRVPGGKRSVPQTESFWGFPSVPPQPPCADLGLETAHWEVRKADRLGARCVDAGCAAGAPSGCRRSTSQAHHTRNT